MKNRLPTAHSVTVLSLLLVGFYRLHLIFVTMGFDQLRHGLAQGDGVTIAILVTLLLNLLAIPLILLDRALGLLLAYFVLTANAVFSGPFLLQDLANPYALPAWIASLAILGGNILGLIFGLIAVLQRLRPQLAILSPTTQRQFLKASVAAFCGMLLLGLALSLASAPATELSQTPEVVIQVELQDMRFRPQHLELNKDQPTALFLINRDDYQHSFDVAAFDLHVTVPPQSSAVAFIRPTQRGQFDLTCEIPGHAASGMVGTLTVR